jgi:hypothetical protein
VTSATVDSKSAALKVAVRSTGGAITTNSTAVGVVDLLHHGIALRVKTSQSHVPVQYSKLIQIGPASYEQTKQNPVTRGHFVRASPADPYIQAGPDVLLGSAQPLAFLNAIEGPLKGVRATTIHGMKVTEYTGSMSLASMTQAIESAGVTVPGEPAVFVNAAPGSMLPLANQVTIPVKVFIDGSDRLVQFESSEPLFTGVYSGDQTESAVQVSAYGLRRYYAHGTQIVTILFSDFGVPVHITPPTGWIDGRCFRIGPLPSGCPSWIVTTHR